MNLRRALLAVAALAAVAPALAQQTPPAYPTRPVRVIIGVTPGGIQDLLARGVALELGKLWGQPVVVENHAGATGIIAATMVAKAPADGYTLLMSTANNMESAPVLQKNLPFDTIKDFIPVVGLAQTRTMIVGSNKLQANTVKELADLAHAKPGALNFGSWGVGSTSHLDGLAFAKSIGGEFSHVPYKGGNDVMMALASGQIDFAAVTVSTALPLVKQGKVKALAYAGSERSSLLPDMPTLAELGYTFDRPGGVFAFYLPAGTPQAVVDKLAADTLKAANAPAFVNEFITANGMEPYPYRGAELGKRLDESRRNYLARMKALNFQID
jgi:tripartite-type tricarboxylate transporter receptor subunit TctC